MFDFGFVFEGDEEKVGFLWELEGAKQRLKIFQADLTVEGSFDNAVNGVDGVFHTASPVLVPQDHNIQETLVDPIIKGTTSVMNSCAKSKTLKRIVLTSSCSSIRYRFDATEASPLNESHWSDPDFCKRFNVRKHSSLLYLNFLLKWLFRTRHLV